MTGNRANFEGKLWLIGGTSESRELAMGLCDRAVPWLATVTTERARQLYRQLYRQLDNVPTDNVASTAQASRSPSQPNAPSDHFSPMHTVRVGALTPEQAQQLVVREKICGILDASHPFAVDISQMAIAIAQAQNLPYLRFERSSSIDINLVKLPTQQVFKKADLTDLFQPNFFADHLAKKRILLTTGVKSLSLFQPYLNRAEFWARILPTEASRQQAIASGFPANRLILEQLPITLADETQRCERLHIQVLITKASGDRGGVNIKYQVAEKLNLKLILIERPTLIYPLVTDNLDQAISWAVNITENLTANITANR